MNAMHVHVGEMLDGLSGRVHSFFCGLGGHDLVFNVEPTRLSLKCSSCPYETAGWLVKGKERQPGQTAAVLVTRSAH